MVSAPRLFRLCYPESGGRAEKKEIKFCPDGESNPGSLGKLSTDLLIAPLLTPWTAFAKPKTLNFISAELMLIYFGPSICVNCGSVYHQLVTDLPSVYRVYSLKAFRFGAVATKCGNLFHVHVTFSAQL
ncbi:hypothetical protein ElyMa_006182200 [Elysia marginata]|uniref:Uncharacterized protein n=1 Tax=Elysia marginata TaxID=1093978 RepID=A0AAV4H105_9GAST|nr:hypothetical protein ElyMa_006182200 [Elysia marginata]